MPEPCLSEIELIYTIIFSVSRDTIAGLSLYTTYMYCMPVIIHSVAARRFSQIVFSSVRPPFPFIIAARGNCSYFCVTPLKGYVDPQSRSTNPFCGSRSDGTASSYRGAGQSSTPTQLHAKCTRPHYYSVH